MRDLRVADCVVDFLRVRGHNPDTNDYLFRAARAVVWAKMATAELESFQSDPLAAGLNEPSYHLYAGFERIAHIG